MSKSTRTFRPSKATMATLNSFFRGNAMDDGEEQPWYETEEGETDTNTKPPRASKGKKENDVKDNATKPAKAEKPVTAKIEKAKAAPKPAAPKAEKPKAKPAAAPKPKAPKAEKKPAADRGARRFETWGTKKLVSGPKADTVREGTVTSALVAAFGKGKKVADVMEDMKLTWTPPRAAPVYKSAPDTYLLDYITRAHAAGVLADA